MIWPMDTTSTTSNKSRIRCFGQLEWAPTFTLLSFFHFITTLHTTIVYAAIFV